MPKTLALASLTTAKASGRISSKVSKFSFSLLLNSTVIPLSSSSVIASYLSARASILDKQNEVAALRQELTERESERASLEESDAEYDKKLNDIRIKTRDLGNKKELTLRAHMANESKLEKLTAEIDKMVSRLWDEYELTHATAVALDYPPVTAEDRGAKFARL